MFIIVENIQINYFYCNMCLNINNWKNKINMPSILLKPHYKKKKQHPNNFSRGSPWAALIFNSMFVVVVLCVQFFLKWCFSKIPFSFPFPFLCYFFCFYFLSSIILEFSTCWISPNIGCLIETTKKTAPKQFFKGVAHEQHWSSIVCLLCWTSIVYSLKKKSFFPFPSLQLLSLTSYLVQFSWHPLLDFYGVSMGFL